ncbi:MAG TPA: 1-acyl-sn-glycerol-3-phosphate acyltransferase [Thermoanaerobaculia bacterium]|nr:1-acyl-sn-glycerol-3-phosphate acyltransferase [Thermoanaerobaculia bacterium]
MTRSISLPLWLAAVLFVLAAWAALDRLLVPSVRWVLRRRVNRVIDELNTRLSLAIKPFQRTKRQVLIDRLMYDPQVLVAAEDHARAGGMPREVAMAKVERYAREIVPSFNAYAYFRIGYALARSVARLLYRVRLGYADEKGLAAVDPQSTVVFLMNHRSNMDYILVAYLAADRTALSYAVGEWARIWPLQTLIRTMGAYFVRRSSGDPLYRRVLERYIAMATAGGVTQAVYPEGGLTRDGRLRPPKLGLLDYMLRGFDPAGERDLVFIPLGINYDRVLEDRTLLLDLPPMPRMPPTSPTSPETPRTARPGILGATSTTFRFGLRNVLLMLRSRWHRFGYACVDFGSPVSTKAWLAARRLDFRPLGKEERFRHLGELATELMTAIGRSIPVVPVPLVATVFLRHPGERLSELEVKAEALGLMRELTASGAHVYLPRQDQDYAIEAGLRMLTLRHLVDEEGGLYTARPEEVRLLSYYAGSIAHLLGGSGAAENPVRKETYQPL